MQLKEITYREKKSQLQLRDGRERRKETFVKVEHENNDELSRVSTMTSQKSTSGMASSAFGNDRSPAIQHHFCACRRLSLKSLILFILFVILTYLLYK